MADLSGSLGIQPYQGVMEQLHKMEESKSDMILKWAGDYFNGCQPPVPVELLHRSGTLVDCLADYEDDVDLIVLGKRGENANFAKAHLGSTLERVLRTASKPCLVTSRKYQEIKRAILAYDGGESSRKALDFWISASYLHDIELHVVVVAEDKAESVSLKRLQEVEDRLTKAGVKPILQMLHGQPESVIAEYVVDHGVDLLLIGAYGHSRIRQLLIGSTTTAMVRSCRIPVLLFH